MEEIAIAMIFVIGLGGTSKDSRCMGIDAARDGAPMEPRHKLHDVVRLRKGLPEHGIPPGTAAAIVEVHESRDGWYEIEIVEQESGRTIWSGPVGFEELEAITDVANPGRVTTISQLQRNKRSSPALSGLRFQPTCPLVATTFFCFWGQRAGA